MRAPLPDAGNASSKLPRVCSLSPVLFYSVSLKSLLWTFSLLTVLGAIVAVESGISRIGVGKGSALDFKIILTQKSTVVKILHRILAADTAITFKGRNTTARTVILLFRNVPHLLDNTASNAGRVGYTVRTKLATLTSFHRSKSNVHCSVQL